MNGNIVYNKNKNECLDVKCDYKENFQPVSRIYFYLRKTNFENKNFLFIAQIKKKNPKMVAVGFSIKVQNIE